LVLEAWKTEVKFDNRSAMIPDAKKVQHELRNNKKVDYDNESNYWSGYIV